MGQAVKDFISKQLGRIKKTNIVSKIFTHYELKLDLTVILFITALF